MAGVARSMSVEFTACDCSDDATMGSRLEWAGGGAAYKGTRSENNLQLFEANTQMRSNQLSNWTPSDCSDCEARSEQKK